ncbi:MAG: VTT domain-containing protein [Bacteroidia bacterium]|nr:VTT domain-containing protein [Bacteroidia bacterium]MDW8159071.1 VTT domain-containing protein [Bacteroidia bacterium]
MEWLSSIQDFFTKLVDPKTIIETGGLWLVVLVVFAETGLLAGFFLPGDSLLFLVGLSCATKIINNTIYEVLFFITLAAILGDSFGYYIGKKGGPKVFNKKESLFFKPEYVTMTREYYQRHGAWALVIGRFLPIIRTFAPVMAGVIQMEYKKFIFYNVTGGILWVFSLCLIGYLLGEISYIQKNYEKIVIFLVIVTAIPIIRMILKERKRNRAVQLKNKEKDIVS